LILEKRYAAAAQKLLKGFRLNSLVVGKIVKQNGVKIL
jgi:hypothetical protein